MQNGLRDLVSLHNIVTDQGAQFESEIFTELSKLLGFQRKRTTSYNPKANGFIERWHRTLKQAIMCYNRSDWTKILPSILLGLRTTFRDDFNTSSAELVYGSTLRIPTDFLTNNNTIVTHTQFASDLKDHFKLIRPSLPSRHCNTNIFISKNLNTCSHVFLRTDSIRKSLQPPYEGPFPVIKRSDKQFVILIKNKQVKISIDRLKPCFKIDENDTQTQTSKLSSNIPNDKLDNQILRNKRKVQFNDQEPNCKSYTTQSGRATRILISYR